MKTETLKSLCAAAVGIVVSIIVARCLFTPDASNQRPVPAVRPADQVAAIRPTQNARSSELETMPAPVPPSAEASQPATEAADRAKAEERIQELATSYNAASVPALAAYLSARDPEVRTAARTGLIVLGDESAVPHLQKASELAADADEAKALREAAQYLALPPASARR